MTIVLVTDRAGVLTLAEGDGLSKFRIKREDVGKPIAVAAASTAAVVDGCRRALDGQLHVAAANVNVDGTRFDLRCDALRLEGADVAGAVVVAVERPESEQARLARGLADAQRVAHVGSFEWAIASNVVSWSDELHRIYGLEPGTFEGTYEAYLNRVHPDDVHHTQSVIFDAFRTAKPFVYDHRIVRSDGEVRVLHTRGEVVVDEQGKAARIVGSCWDISEMRDAQRRLERSLSLLQASLESTADGILVVDRRGKTVAHNQRLLELWRVSRTVVEETDFETLLSLVHDQIENGEECLRRVNELRTQPEAESFDSIRFRDGRVFERYSRPQRIGDEIVGRVWSYRDVTDRQGLLTRTLFLADASRLLTSLDVEAGLEGVARRALPAVAEACAVDLFADAGGPRRLLSISLDPTRPLVLELPRKIFDGEPLMETKPGSSYVMVPGMSRHAVLGAFTFAMFGERRYGEADLSLFQELAARAGLAIENARLYRRASEALAARDEFLAIAAHEIRGPVTSLHIAVQGLQQPQTSAPARTKMLEIIEREDRRLARFVDELLDVARVRCGGLRFDLQPVDLAEIVRESVGRLAPDITRSRSSMSVSTTGAVLGIWDRVRLEQVVNNLLTNAIKFGLGRPIEVTVSEAGGVAKLRVRDHGIGIPVDRQERIFEPFERAVSVRHYGGLGLGLYIVRRIVEGLGGKITLQSQPHEGSSFIVELPQRRPA